MVRKCIQKLPASNIKMGRQPQGPQKKKIGGKIQEILKRGTVKEKNR